MKTKQMSFDSEQVVAESRPIPDVGNGIEDFLVHTCARDVDAIAGNQFVVAGEIDGRHGVPVTVATAASRRGRNREHAAQQMPRPADFAG